MECKQEILALLDGTKRKGMDAMVKYLCDTGFFESPASTKYHGCYEGGLAKHSLGVFKLVEKLIMVGIDTVSSPGQKPLSLTVDNIIIAALLHDVCKIGAYIGTEKPYKWNKANPKGHATLSIERIKKHIELMEIEEMMIRYHMGVHGLNEFYGEGDWQTGEYPLRGDHSKDESMTREESKAARYGASMGNAWFHNPIVKVMYFCDELATLEEKASEI